MMMIMILLSLVSQLAAVGTAAYTENFVRAARAINTSMAGKVTVWAGVPILASGGGRLGGQPGQQL
jgi:hypothetical protein